MELLLWEAFDMSARPWMPLYVQDFQLDTLELSTDEAGIYIKLLCLAWHNGDGSVTGDMKELKTVLQRLFRDFHGLTFNRIVPKLLERYFRRREDGRFYQERVENELRKAEEISEKQSRIAKERWAKSNKNNDMADANTMPSQSQSQSQSQKDIESASSQGSEAKKGSRLPEDWRPSEDLLLFAAGEGLSAQEIEREAAKFRDYWVGRAGSGGVKLNWSATWRNWVRKAKENKSNARFVQDDSKSASAAAGRLAELAERGHFTFGPRPSLLPKKGTNGVRLLSEGRSEQPGDF
jgi:uncharacterized protein YdaU (DUF1376 family)